ncbi:Alpha/Beta hydrolase protein [Hyaloraphidium curvatum]|nr:Alpha/Beta hydrolase protein [Hyaloraphidium curvatum]
MSIPTADCCSTPVPAASIVLQGTGYAPKGRVIDEFVPGARAYWTGPERASAAIIHVYDIWGFEPAQNNNGRQVADLLSEATGLPVVIIDFFRKVAITQQEMVEKGPAAVQKYAQRTNFPGVVEPDLHAAIATLNKVGCTAFGVVGFCWGGKICIQAVGTPALVAKGVRAAASVHPAMLEMSDAEKVGGAVCLLPSKDEPEIVSGEFWETIHKKEGVGARSVHKRFSDVFHGWCQTRGNFSDPLNKQRAEEAVAMIADFFRKELVDGAAPSL